MFFYSLVRLHIVHPMIPTCLICCLPAGFTHIWCSAAGFLESVLFPSKSIVMKSSVKFLQALYDPVSEYFHQRGEIRDAEVKMRKWEVTEN